MCDAPDTVTIKLLSQGIDNNEENIEAHLTSLSNVFSYIIGFSDYLKLDKLFTHNVIMLAHNSKTYLETLLCSHNSDTDKIIPVIKVIDNFLQLTYCDYQS